MDGLGLGGLGRIARNVLRPRQPDGQTCGDRNYKPVVCNAPSSTVTSTLLACNLCSNRTNLMLSRLLSLLAALVAYAPASCEMHVFIHTDRATRPPPPGSGFVLHTGVSSEPKFHASSLSDPSVSHSNIYAPEKNSWMRQQARKFEWALQTARAHRAPEPWLLADTDVIIQCGAEALRRRFEAAQTDLLIGAEAAWWPSADPRQNPYPYRGVPLRYPNSGLLLGTQRGFEQLVVQLQQISQGAWSHTNWPGLTLAAPNTSAGPNIGGAWQFGRAWHWLGLALVGSAYCLVLA